jgi:hypothetical protein
MRTMIAFGCLLLLAAGGCTREEPSDAPQVTLAQEGMGLLTQAMGRKLCFELRPDIAKGSRGDFVQSSGMTSEPGDTSVVAQLGASFRIDNNRLAAGGAVDPSVVTVTVNGQPAHLDQRYFLAVLPAIPDSDVHIVAADKEGHMVAQGQYPRAIIVRQQVPGGANPPG